ncbi:aspartate:alanine exchanger family transporter [Crocosphaera sp. XPORK-15E]|uniref:aspartate:alanine exchanger family transporter n=1 Tax=Crocosphaera sp. XPORK-15E TaxID=3110247 RepID=UPI002B205BED|nr:TrkA C-terminal domain-containing protein [Crocosphaera sp. XPORK-15E]MEA5536638.1 TrkA C-terminal domain-containing protein [Crocosphaera sp. XPORK-15E]
MLLALSYLIGRIKIGQLNLGAPPGMLIAGLVLGALGFTVFPGIQTIGLFLFLYAVAFQAGPSFFSVVMADGLNYASLAAIATLVGFVLTYGATLIFQFDPGVAAGLLTGSLTTPAGLAAALDVMRAGEVPLPPGLTTEQVLQNINVTYALTFLVADIAVILLSRNLPRLFRFDLRAESFRTAQEKHIEEKPKAPNWSLTLRAYEVQTQEMINKTITDLQELSQCTVLAHKRDGMVMEFQPNTLLHKGDRLAIWGKVERQDWLDDLMGAEVADEDLLSSKIVNRDVIVTKPEAFGKSLYELDITQQYACYPLRLSRSGIDLALTPTVTLSRGDVLTLSGPQIWLDKLASQIGFFEQDINATDLLTCSLGIIVGFLIGQISFSVGGIAIGLGTSGGLLLMGLILGYLRSTHPSFGRIPPATLWVFKELGLLLFLEGVGISAGQGLVTAMQSQGLVLLLCSLLISTMPVIVAFLFGLHYLKMNPALLLGAVTGSVTCTPAMAAVSSDAKSSIPTIGYAGTYAFATVLCAIVGSIMAHL